ncbi:MAG: transglycosylase SLT domain-containing protein, partial [Chloroflexota bacterium]
APEMAAYVQPQIAICYLSLGDQAAAVAAYEAAVRGPAHRLTLIELRLRLAELYVAAGQYAQAIAQYETIHEQAVTENTRGQVTYLAGYAELLAGETEAGYARYLRAVNDYPRAYESYLSLVALVEAGYTVDDYQRGLVDYYAGAYEPAVAAFERYLVSHPAEARPDAHLYRAWSYSALGNLAAALAALDAYLATAPDDPTTAGRAWLERADLFAQYGRTAEAIDTYRQFAQAYPTHPQASTAAWEAAVLTEEVEAEAAAAEYLALVDRYPGMDKAPAALFRAGLLFHLNGDDEQAQAAWRRLVEAYPNTEEGAAGLIWLIKTLPPDQARPYRDLAAASRPSESYYPLRAYHLATDADPFNFQPSTFNVQPSTTAQAEAEAWLREKLGLEATADVSSLSPALAQDERLRLGTRLWQLGLWAEARRELEGLREAYAQDPLATYQLALTFRDLGLYRSSIVAAASLLRQLGANVFTAPPFLGRLSYPVYYADLILPLADQYGYDPLLQLALVRQESLFESFATSSAAAQGLSQVIPDTGAYIALKLGWPDYVNEDLYKPYVGLAFGAYYLDEQLRAFAGNVYVALSAYNGGPGNAARWYGTAGDDLDLYLETVSFAETRAYIERIYVGYAAYQTLYRDE